MKKQKIKAYMCQTDWDTELPLGAQDIRLTTDLAYLKKRRTCLKECGVVEVEITLKKVLTKGTNNWRK